ARRAGDAAAVAGAVYRAVDGHERRLRGRRRGGRHLRARRDAPVRPAPHRTRYGSHPVSPVPTKQELRLQLAARLATIEPAHRRSAAAAASERWLAQPEVLAGGGVLICLSFGDEIDTAGVVEALT